MLIGLHRILEGVYKAHGFTGLSDVGLGAVG